MMMLLLLFLLVALVVTFCGDGGNVDVFFLFVCLFCGTSGGILCLYLTPNL